MILKVLVTNPTLKKKTTEKAKQSTFVGWILSMGHQFVTLCWTLLFTGHPTVRELITSLAGAEQGEGEKWRATRAQGGVR